MAAERERFLKLTGLGIGALLVGSYLNHTITIDLFRTPNCMVVRFGHFGSLITIVTAVMAINIYRKFKPSERRSYDIGIALAFGFCAFMAFFLWFSTFIVQNCPALTPM